MHDSHNEQGFPLAIGFGRGRGFGRERLMRGHLNMIILEIIKARPRHGYDVIKAIEEKCHGLYSPSAGSVYPILQELEDQDFVRSAEARGKRIYSITNDGQQEEKGLNFTEQLHPFRRFATLCRGRSRSGSSVVATEPSRAHSKTPAPSRTRKRRRSGSSAPGCSRSRWCRRAAAPHRLGSVLHPRGCSRRLASGPV